MTNPVLGIDASFASISREQFRLMYQDGYRVFCQDLWTGVSSNMPRENNLRNAMAEGFIVGGYIVTNRNGPANVLNARVGFPADLWDSLTFVPVDVEVDGTRAEDVYATVDYVEELGKPRCVYSAYWFWHGRMGNPPKPPRCTLWNALYDNVQSLDFPIPYGGWTVDELLGKQYRGSHQLHGAEVDANVFDLDKLGGPIVQVLPFWMQEGMR